MKKIINIIIIFVVLWSLAGFFGMDLFHEGATFKNKEFPLSEPNGVVVDSIGNIYIGSNFYCMIQVYNQKGECINNFEVDCHTGSFFIGINNDDNIEVYSVRGSEKSTYNHQGQLLSQEVLDINFGVLEIKKNSFTDKQGNKYELKKWIYPKIIKNGKTIITQNIFYKSLTVIQCMIIAIIGFFSLVIINRRWIEKLFNFKAKSIWFD